MIRADKDVMMMSEVGDKYFRKECPMLDKVIRGKRFLLPQYRQNDYASQDVLNDDFEFGLVATAAGAMGYHDDVHHSQVANFFGALWFDRPIMFLEKELARPLLEADLPPDMRTSDINWRWPQLRVMLPLGLLTIERDGKLRNVTYIDMMLIDEEGIGMPSKYVPEIEAFSKRHAPDFLGRRVPMGELVIRMKERYIAVVCQIDYSEIGFGATTYAYTAPWNNDRLTKLVSYKGGLNSALKCDGSDEKLLEEVKHLALNILLFLSQKPVIYQPKVVRALKYEGKHLKPALAEAHFIGKEQFKAAMLKGGPKRAKADPTGKTTKAHWVKGHWRRVPYGPKAELRRFQWIGLYHTYGTGEEEGI